MRGWGSKRASPTGMIQRARTAGQRLSLSAAHLPWPKRTRPCRRCGRAPATRRCALPMANRVSDASLVQHDVLDVRTRRCRARQTFERVPNAASPAGASANSQRQPLLLARRGGQVRARPCCRPVSLAYFGRQQPQQHAGHRQPHRASAAPIHALRPKSRGGAPADAKSLLAQAVLDLARWGDMCRSRQSVGRHVWPFLRVGGCISFASITATNCAPCANDGLPARPSSGALTASAARVAATREDPHDREC